SWHPVTTLPPDDSEQRERYDRRRENAIRHAQARCEQGQPRKSGRPAPGELPSSPGEILPAARERIRVGVDLGVVGIGEQLSVVADTPQQESAVREGEPSEARSFREQLARAVTGTPPIAESQSQERSEEKGRLGAGEGGQGEHGV